MRIAIVIGLHLNIPVSQLGDPEAREHRRRLFWTTYVFDRISASSLCFPPAIQDEEIKVNMPSNPLADQTLEGDFADPAYYIAQLQLASLISKVVRSIYRQTTQTATLSSRVQHVLKDLWTWVNDLPTQLRLDAITNTSTEPTPVPLHLFFNQVSEPYILFLYNACSNHLIPIVCYPCDSSRTPPYTTDTCSFVERIFTPRQARNP